MASTTALKAWELENAVKLVDPRRDALYKFSAADQLERGRAKVWQKDAYHFASVHISALALLKMVMHARAGGQLEVMGLMVGYVLDRTFVVTDSVRLPVEGTETRVNAQDDANEYMVRFLEDSRRAGQTENAVGWYHSHPGYGCWLSGIDVATQRTQQLQDPFVAVVIDPDRTVSTGRVDIGAFRALPNAGGGGGGRGKASVGASASATRTQAVPPAKMADFGAHANEYYSLEVAHFKSSLDASLLEALWTKYWTATLSTSPLLSLRDYRTAQIRDLVGMMKRDPLSKSPKKPADPDMDKLFAKDTIYSEEAGGTNSVPMSKLVCAANKIRREEEMGLLARQVKERVFGSGGAAAPHLGHSSDAEMKS